MGSVQEVAAVKPPLSYIVFRSVCLMLMSPLTLIKCLKGQNLSDQIRKMTEKPTPSRRSAVKRYLRICFSISLAGQCPRSSGHVVPLYTEHVFLNI